MTFQSLPEFYCLRKNKIYGKPLTLLQTINFWLAFIPITAEIKKLKFHQRGDSSGLKKIYKTLHPLKPSLQFLAGGFNW